MKEFDVLKLQDDLKRELKESRYRHILGVSYTAQALAMRYEEDLKKAEIAGLLHDCAKQFDDEKMLKYAKKYKISISEKESQNVQLLHAKVGGFMAKEEYGIDDEDIINSILYHTTGRPEMSMLEKIIYIADYIEPGRYRPVRIKEVRKEAFIDIDKALLMILEDTLNLLKEKGYLIDPMTEKTYEYYKGLKND